MCIYVHNYGVCLYMFVGIETRKDHESEDEVLRDVGR